MSAARLRIFDRNGWPLCELMADVASVLWRLGETGEIAFAVAYRNQSATRANLAPGNRVLWEGAGLPEWGGVLDFPVRRTSTGLELRAYEGDRILGWRISERTAAFSSSAYSAVVQALLDSANAAGDTGVSIGALSGGGSYTRDFHYANLLSAFRGLREETGYDYAVVPHYVDRRLTFKLYWYERRGEDRRDEVALVEGLNATAVVVDEQGPVYNQVVVIGEGDTWADRPVVIRSHGGSRASYSLRQFPSLYLDISDTTTLEGIADALLEELAHPRARGSLQVVDRDPGRFDAYHVGDVVTLQCFLTAGEWGFDEPVRILARQWTPDGLCTLEVEQWWD